MIEPLYYMRVETMDHRTLVQIVGARETVLDVALRVVLDNAESLSQPDIIFTVRCAVQR
jgi:hypothetical protein